MDHRQRELLEKLLQRMREYALVLLDADGRVLRWFPGAEEITGWSADEMAGQTLDRLFEPHERALGVPVQERETAAGAGRSEDDRWTLRHDGSRFWANGAMLGVRDDAGRLLGFAKVFRDRTDIRLLLDRLENRAHHLDQREAERVRLLATLAHELRSPLGAIVNAIALLRHDAPADRDASMPLDVLTRQVEAIGRLVDDLTGFVRHGTATQALDLEPVDMGRMLAEAIETCRPAIDERGHSVETFLPACPFTCVADRLRLRQVLVNLITNAARYTPHGGHIWIHATIEGDEAVVSVRDNGAGIAPELQPRVFELFTRAGGGDLGGTALGLGLALVKELAEQHGGSVQVRSEGRGKGSEFTVRLPCRGATRGADANGPASPR